MYGQFERTLTKLWMDIAHTKSQKTNKSSCVGICILGNQVYIFYNFMHAKLLSCSNVETMEKKQS